MRCGVVHRGGLDPVLLWPWHGPVATAPMGPPAWEPPCAVGAAQEMAKKDKKKIFFVHDRNSVFSFCFIHY